VRTQLASLKPGAIPYSFVEMPNLAFGW